MPEITYRLNPPVTNAQLNSLFAVSWPDHHTTDFRPVLDHSLLYVCAYQDEQMVGYVYLAWDGGIHAFLLNPTVHPDFRRQGIGVKLVQVAIEAARSRDILWIHVDYEPHLRAFYQQCGFSHSEAGLLTLKHA